MGFSTSTRLSGRRTRLDRRRESVPTRTKSPEVRVYPWRYWPRGPSVLWPESDLDVVRCLAHWRVRGISALGQEVLLRKMYIRKPRRGDLLGLIMWRTQWFLVSRNTLDIPGVSRVQSNKIFWRSTLWRQKFNWRRSFINNVKELCHKFHNFFNISYW